MFCSLKSLQKRQGGVPLFLKSEKFLRNNTFYELLEGVKINYKNDVSTVENVVLVYVYTYSDCRKLQVRHMFPSVTCIELCNH